MKIYFDLSQKDRTRAVLTLRQIGAAKKADRYALAYKQSRQPLLL
jgi:hypothetical protein